uniref:Uncharacterized protein n=1 Tax=Acrobeloides nanus TaxID=290746 RepID=A0A914E911_9BILA
MKKVRLRLIFLIGYILFGFVNGSGYGGYEYPVNPYQAMMPQKSLSQLDNMISMCFRSICKEWMHECHWHCDSINTQDAKKHCMECLSMRGSHCLDCFEL